MELLSSFTAPPLFRVLHGQREVGLLDQMSFLVRDEQKPVVLLAGRGWQVTHLDWNARVAYVVPTDLKGRSRWLGSSPPLSFALCRAMRDVLAADDAPPAWSRRAREGVEQAKADVPWCEAGSTVLNRCRQ